MHCSRKEIKVLKYKTNPAVPENDEDWATWEQPEMTDSDYVTQDMIDGLIEKYPDNVLPHTPVPYFRQGNSWLP